MLRIIASRARGAAVALALSQKSQQKTFHSSAVALARSSRRSGGGRKSALRNAASAQFMDDDDDDDDDEEEEDDGEAWLEHVRKQQTMKRSAVFGEDDSETAVDSNGDFELDEKDYDEDTKEFLSEVDELFSLQPQEFERRMKSFDKDPRHARKALQEADEDDDDDEEDEAGLAFDEYEVNRATERIPKSKLLKVLDELSPSKTRSGRHEMTAPKAKMAAPLEKKAKKVNADRVSYRQEKVELSVLHFVQDLLTQEDDSSASDVVVSLTDASVAPDLRRVVLFWEPVRVNSTNQTISKRKVAGIKSRLERQEKWVRMQVTRHLNLKYSPNVQFKQGSNIKSQDARAMFDSEMEWLNSSKRY